MPMHFMEAPTNFYLGAKVDSNSHKVVDDDVIYYDSRDLTTHGVILGMTGSGKTGLAIGILEEAVIDGIPSLIIDPKGDMTNLLLAFPDFTADNFLPWVNPEDAVRAGHTIEQHAQVEADAWKQGLADWGITNDRVQAFRRAARFSIYTPGSEAGLKVSILQSLAAPKEGWAGNEEMLREKLTGTVTAILALVGINAQPVQDREHVLLSNIFEYNWRNGTSLTMEQLITQVQRPPFTKLGVLDVDNVFPEKDRLKLAQLLNNIIAAPNFQNWITGEPIDIPSFLYTPEGYPRTTIFYVQHLSDAERQFFTTLLLEAVIAWTHTLTGTTSLRALVYIDEVVGMFPPSANPPTKAPILTLLKQARAFGIGMVVATQNPKDIDYKGLANAGTWFIGKMQTDNDRARVLEGLDSARDATSTLDVKSVSGLIGSLGPREFILHDIHKPETPILMSSRWTMSFLRGPLNRQQISQLMANQRGLQASAAALQKPAMTVATSTGQAPPMAPQAQSVSYTVPTAAAANDQAQVAPIPQVPGGPDPYQTPAPAAVQAAPAPAPAIPQVPAPQPAPAPQPVQAAPPPTYSGVPDTAPQAAAPAQPALPVVPAAAPADDSPAGFSSVQPVLPSSVYQFYLPTEYTVEQAIRNWEQWMRQPAVQVETKKRLLYRPALLAQLAVLFNHKQTNSQQVYYYAFVVPNLPRSPLIDWGQYASETFDPHALDPNPFAEAYYAEVPSTLAKGTGFKDLQNNLIDFLSLNTWLTVYYNPVLKLYSSLYESQRDFQARVQAQCRQERDKEVDTVAQRYDTKMSALEARINTFQARAEQKQDEVGARKQEETLSAGEDLLGMVHGRSEHLLSRATRLRRYSTTAENRLGIYEQQIQNLDQQIQTLQSEMEQALQAVQDKWVSVVGQVQEVRVTPLKKDITPQIFGVGWVPYWDAVVNGNEVILPASSSGLGTAQE